MDMRGSYVRTKRIRLLRSLSVSGSRNPNWQGGRVERRCMTCNKNYPASKSDLRSKTCSPKCLHIWQKGKNFLSPTGAKKLSRKATERIHNPRSKFGKGFGTIIKKGGETFFSTFEFRYAKVARSLGWIVERNTDRFLYLWKGKEHFYTPDFKVNGAYVEVKGWIEPVSLAKILAVQAQGFEISMISGHGISLLEKEVVKCQSLVA